MAWVPLGIAGTEEFLVRFEGSSESPSRWVKSEGDGLRVLVGRVECIAKIHEEGVTSPTEAFFDVRVGVPSSVE